MEFFTSQIDTIRWLFSPVGLVTTLALTSVLLSGLPGAILLRVERPVVALETAKRPDNDLPGREKIPR